MPNSSPELASWGQKKLCSTIPYSPVPADGNLGKDTYSLHTPAKTLAWNSSPFLDLVLKVGCHLLAFSLVPEPKSSATLQYPSSPAPSQGARVGTSTQTLGVGKIGESLFLTIKLLSRCEGQGLAPWIRILTSLRPDILPSFPVRKKGEIKTITSTLAPRQRGTEAEPCSYAYPPSTLLLPVCLMFGLYD